MEVEMDHTGVSWSPRRSTPRETCVDVILDEPLPDVPSGPTACRNDPLNHGTGMGRDLRRSRKCRNGRTNPSFSCRQLPRRGPKLLESLLTTLKRVGRPHLRAEEEESQERLLSEVYSLTTRYNELYHRNADLTRELLLVSQTNAALDEKLKKTQEELCSQLDASGVYVDGFATPSLLESTLATLNAKVPCLAKQFVDLMKGNGLDHKLALTTHYKGTYLTRHAHVSFILKAWIYSVFFENIENESFLPGGATQFFDGKDRKSHSFEYFQTILGTDRIFDYLTSEAFGTFCREKLRYFLALWESNSLSPGILERSRLLQIEPRTSKFIQGFVAVAQAVWAIHKLCLSFEPCARILRVKPGSDLKEDYMNSVVSKEDDPKFVSEVGFMISPGFCVGKSIVKCEIYLAGC